MRYPSNFQQDVAEAYLYNANNIVWEGNALQKSCTSQRNLFKKSETYYCTFFQSMIEFIHSYFFTHSSAISSPDDRLLAEQLMIDSLLLTEKMHMHLLYRQPLYEQLPSFHQESGPFCESLSNDIYLSLKDLKRYAQQHTFASEVHHFLCQNIISQLLSYYPQHLSPVEIRISGSLCPPWKPPS